MGRSTELSKLYRQLGPFITTARSLSEDCLSVENVHYPSLLNICCDGLFSRYNTHYAALLGCWNRNLWYSNEELRQPSTCATFVSQWLRECERCNDASRPEPEIGATHQSMMRLVIGGFAVLIALLRALMWRLPRSQPLQSALCYRNSLVRADPALGGAGDQGWPACIRAGLWDSADLRTLQKIGPETNFRLASLTKQFTAAAVMLLVHDGKLRYEDRLTDVFQTSRLWEGDHHPPVAEPYFRSGRLRRHHRKEYAGIADNKIPQIRDAGVLDLLKAADEHEVHAQARAGNTAIRVMWCWP